MKFSIICCLLMCLIYECIDRVNGANRPLNFGFARRAINTLPIARSYGYPRRLVQYMPVPIVKKVTHHHIHHVIAHKGVVKSKYAAEGNNGLDFDNKDNDNKNSNHLNYKTFKEEIGLKGDLNDDGFRSYFSKRVTTPVSPTTAESFGDLLATSSVHMRQPIRGYIGGQRAEFLPIVIGIIDETGELISGGDSDRQYSSRKGLLRPGSNGKEYIPSKETIKLFQDLAKIGFK